MCMPKLDSTHIADRLRERLAELKADKEVAPRELRALLNEAQLKAIDDAWTHQQHLRKTTKARTKEQQVELGYKTKREIYIEVYKQALSDLDLVAAFDHKLRSAEIRQAKIFMDSYTAAINNGKTSSEAKTIANNDLTRAKLTRIDGQKVTHRSKRDREVAEMEAQLKQQLGIKDNSDT